MNSSVIRIFNFFCCKTLTHVMPVSPTSSMVVFPVIKLTGSGKLLFFISFNLPLFRHFFFFSFQIGNFSIFCFVGKWSRLACSSSLLFIPNDQHIIWYSFNVIKGVSDIKKKNVNNSHTSRLSSVDPSIPRQSWLGCLDIPVRKQLFVRHPSLWWWVAMAWIWADDFSGD